MAHTHGHRRTSTIHIKHTNILIQLKENKKHILQTKSNSFINVIIIQYIDKFKVQNKI